ncbi:MAG: efflux RND transporter periplasmic adaptor subunit [Magnetococcus sp. MYC-9]
MSHKQGNIGRLLLPVGAVLGLGVMAYAVVAGDENYPLTSPLSIPASSPYTHTVAGAGLVEASSQNIAVGSALAGIVTTVVVQTGQSVAGGDPLFHLDNRLALAERGVRQAALLVAERRLTEANAAVQETSFLLQQVKGLQDNRAVSREEVQRRQTADALARARVASAEASIRQARAELEVAQTELERLTVRAPVTGEVLQVNVRPGEYLSSAGNQPAPVIVGETSTLHVRVDIDENDAWRLKPEAQATANLRGNAAIRTPVTWVRTEPLVIPKRSLTGSSAERVDTRVLQLLFAFKRGDLPIHVGQQMDVFIEAAPDLGAAP